MLLVIEAAKVWQTEGTDVNRDRLMLQLKDGSLLIPGTTRSTVNPGSTRRVHVRPPSTRRVQAVPVRSMPHFCELGEVNWGLTATTMA